MEHGLRTLLSTSFFVFAVEVRLQCAAVLTLVLAVKPELEGDATADAAFCVAPLLGVREGQCISMAPLVDERPKTHARLADEVIPAEKVAVPDFEAQSRVRHLMVDVVAIAPYLAALEA